AAVVAGASSAAGAAVVAAAESPPDELADEEMLSPSSDPQALAIRVNASPRAISTRRCRRMVPSMVWV
ncbi:MAG TPA: hypothetical protein DCR10_03835, partial [Acidimicrobiaceae bacterium]|nr:hypothetical protein [Acidimicrobiaceae bacterium]